MFHNNLMHSHTYYIDYHLLTVDIHRYNKHYHLNRYDILNLYNFLCSFTSPHFYLIINSLTAKERKQMIDIQSSTIIFTIFNLIIIVILIIGIIFLIYHLIKKLIKYNKTEK